MSRLINELTQVSVKRQKQLSSVIALTETQRLIADKGAEDMSILQGMGMHHSILRAQNIKSAKLETEALEAKYGKVFTAEEIKQVACTYALKFLRTDKYKGNIDPEMLQKMKEFFADADIEMNKAKLGFDFFILAPPEAFNLENRPVPQPIDPILFYKLDETHYRMIHKWGSELTWFRKLVGFKHRNHFTFFLTWFLFLLASGLIIGNVANFFIQKQLFNWWTLAAVLPAIVLSLIRTNTNWGTDFKPWSKEYTEAVKPKF